jgi:tRNA (guanine37-N1)-methyltransferase
VKTVVNKLNSIHNEFRFFDMEVLAGAPEFVTTTSESGCTFTFDFSKVYWNSRLHTEHARVVHQFEPGTVVADAMAGVGPFAVPAAKRGAYVLANDLNPESTKWMAENEKKNKVSERMRVTNIDAREFIRTAPLEAWTRPFKRSEPKTNKQKDAERKARLQAEQAGGVGVSASASGTAEQKQKEKPGPPAPQTISHYVMNLPDSALEFLDAYPGAFTPLLSQPGYDRNTPLPLVHVHCFTRFLEPETARDDINARASQRLGYTLTHAEDGYYLHPVRRVAPNKDMYCLTFRLPAEVAYRVL